MAQLNTVKGHQTGAGVRGRDAEFPSAPAHVSDNAQAVALDINTVRQFYFSNQHPGRIPDRPSTSGGTGTTSDFPVRRNARKRETKDDLYFRPPASHGQETTLYNFPLPRSLPTPSSSPRESTPLPRKSSLLPRPSTLDSIEAEREVEMPQMEIGMAIGSPSHPPATWRQSKFESHAWSQYPDPMEDSMDDSIAPAPVKQKSSRWKMLGGLFGGGKKQNSAQAQAFYQLQPERQQQMPAEPGHVHFGESPESKPRGRGRTNSERKIGRKKPDMKRSNTAPQQFDLEPSRVRPANPQITLDGGPIVDNVIQREPSDGGLMLNVDIPSVEMERYSVMFGSLLPKTPGLHSPLLARRQATLDKLKTVNEELALKVSLSYFFSYDCKFLTLDNRKKNWKLNPGNYILDGRPRLNQGVQRSLFSQTLLHGKSIVTFHLGTVVVAPLFIAQIPHQQLFRHLAQRSHLVPTIKCMPLSWGLDLTYQLPMSNLTKARGHPTRHPAKVRRKRSRSQYQRFP